MPLDRLLDEIRERSKRELATETERTAIERRRIAADTDRRIAQLREEIARRAQAEANRERLQRLAAAKLEGRRLQFAAQEQRLLDTLATAKSILGNLTKDPRYPKILSRMYQVAEAQLGDDCKVHGRPEDTAALRKIAGAGAVSAPVSISGGLIAETPDGLRRLDLSFEELLRLRQDRLLALARS
jgi:vacuolar-type H+-ATPase subunit E/Vma4